MFLDGSRGASIYARYPSRPRPRRRRALLAIVRGLIAPLAHAVVAHDGGDPQPVVAEHAAASCLLRGAMLRLVAPSGDRRLVAPERQRQHLVGIGDALEALDGKKPVDPLKFCAQARGMVEIALTPAVGGPHLEDDGDH